MIRGLYTAASGMIVQQKRQENTSNNIANIETPSFKRQSLIVEARDSLGVIKRNCGENTSIGTIEMGVEIDGTVMDFSQGLLRETGLHGDLAIDGQGYFITELPSGQTAYTRSGSVRRDTEGILRNAEGFCICGEKASGGRVEPIKIETEKFTVDGEGNIIDDDGKRIYKIVLADFEDLSLLKEDEAGVLVLPEGEEDNEISAKNARIVSGMKEASNVNALDEMVKLMEISRSFESNQRILQSLDETLGKAVNELGKL